MDSYKIYIKGSACNKEFLVYIMYIKSEYPFRWRYEYVPTYYEGLTEEQRKIQRTVLDFKNGDYDDGIMEWFRRQIYKMVKGEEYAWVICFLPCTNDVRKHSRFQNWPHT